MKQTYKKISKALVILATVLLVLIGCSDMMVKIGDIVLKIEAEDTIRTYVETYTVTGSLQGSKSSSLSFEDVKPDQEVLVPNIAPGKWTFTVVAFDAAKKQIGTGTTEIILAEGQKVDLRVPVLFDPLPLGIGEPLFPETLDKVYDGTTTLTVTAGALSGLVSGYEGVRAEARATYADKGAGKDKAVTVSYDLVYDDATITNKYDSLADNTAYTGDIHQRQLTISAPIFPTTKNKEYDGTNTLAVTAGDFTNLVEGDDVTVTAHAWYSDKNAEENKVITITYIIEGSDAANYITPVTDTSHSGSIAKKPLTFTIAANDRKYNGDTTAEGAITLAGMVPSDAGAVGATGTFAFSDKNVGSEKTVSVTAITLTGGEKDNYTLAEREAATTATISKKTFDMSGITFEDVSRIYNNEAFELAINGTLPEGVSVSYSGNTGNIHVGTYEVTASFSVDEANHEIIDDMVATLTIEKKVLTREGTYLKLSKPYDKNRTALFTLDQEKSGKVRGDKINVSIEAYYSDASVGPNRITVTYALTGDNIRNYTRPENYIEPAGVIMPIQLTVESPSLEVTSKTYDGTTALGTTSVTPTGVLPGDTVALTATATYRDKNVGTDKAILVTYALDDNTNYLAPKASTVYAGVITKKVLSVKPNSTQIAPSKIYDGTLVAKVLDAGNLVGVASDDNVVLGATASYQDKNVLLDGDTPQPKPVTVLYSLSGLHVGNYTLEETSNSADYSATITRKALGLHDDTTLVDTEKSYDGTRKVLVRSKGILDGLVSGDEVTLATEALYASADVGANNQITVSYTIDGDDKNNYSAPAANTRSFTGTITPKQLSVGAPSFTKRNKIYDGTTSFNAADFSIATTTLKGVYGSDVTLSATASYDDAQASSGKDIRVSYSLINGEGDKANYIAPVDYITNTGMIEKKVLTVATAKRTIETSKVYDGSLAASVSSHGTLEGLVSTDDDVTLETRASYNDKSVLKGNIISVTYSISGSDSKNYTVKQPSDTETLVGTITRKPLSVYANTTQVRTEKSYDGTDTALVTFSGLLNGLVDNDQVVLSAAAKYQESAHAGTDKGITVTYSLTDGADKDNYSAPAANTRNFTGTITPVQLTAGKLSASATSKIYNGGTDLSVTTITPDGFTSGAMNVIATATYGGKHVGTNKAVHVTHALEIANPNYLAPVSYTIYTGEITKKSLTVESGSTQVASTKTYDGNLSATVIFAGRLDQDAIVSGDTVELGATAAFTDKNVAEEKSVTVSYTLSGSDANNYALASSTNTTDYSATITKKPLSVYANTTQVRTEKSYDGTDTALVTFSGLLNGLVDNDQVVLSAAAKYQESAYAGTDKGITVTYSLTDGADRDNYSAPVTNTKSFTGTITPKQLSVGAPSFTKRNKIYDGTTSFNAADFSIATTTLKGVYGSDVTLSATASYDDAQASSGKDIRVSYSLINGEGDKANYIAPVDYITNTGMIEKKVLTVATAKRTIETSKVYDGSLAASVSSHGTLEGLVSTDDDVTLETRASYNDKSVLKGNIISVTYSISGSDSKNYTVKQPSDTETLVGTITRKPLSVYANTTQVQKVKPYDGNNTASIIERGILKGIVGSDKVVLSAEATYQGDSDAGEGKSIVVTYSIPEGDDKDNYSIEGLNATRSFTGSITPIQLTITNPSITTSKDYDGTDSVSVTKGRVIGVLPGYTVSVTATANYGDKNAGTNKVITVSYRLDDPTVNYLAPVPYTVTTGTIMPLQLEITNPSFSSSRTYDSTTTVDVVEGDLRGFAPGEVITLKTVATYDDKKVGTGKSITVRYELHEDDTTNYLAPLPYTVNDGEIIHFPLTISNPIFSNSGTKIYDGDNKVAFTLGTLTGVYDGDLVDIAAIGTYENKNASTTRKDITVRYSLSGHDAENYVVPSPNNAKGLITQRSLRVAHGTTQIISDKIVDGNAEVEVIQPGVLVGVLDTDSVDLMATATYNDDSVNTDKPITVQYQLDGADKGNYTTPANNRSFTGKIVTGQLTISSPTIVKTKTYDTSNDCVVVPSNNIQGIVRGHDVQVKATATYVDDDHYAGYGKDVGTNKKITVVYTLEGDDKDKYTAPSNYYSYEGEILKKQLFIPTPSNIIKEYDGNQTATINPATFVITGKYADDDVTISTVEATYMSPEVRTGKALFISYTWSGADKHNYSYPKAVIIHTAEITKKQLRVQDATTTIATKTYDGSMSATVSNHGNLIGIVTGSEDVILTATAEFTSKSVGTDKEVLVSYSISGSDAGKYIAPVSSTMNTGVITTRTLEIAAPSFRNGTDKVYDDTVVLDGVSPGSLTNKVDGDFVTVSAAASYESVDAGDRAITVTYSIDGADASNYTKPADTTGLSGTIRKKLLTFSTETLFEKEYWGYKSLFISKLPVTGIVDSDEDLIYINARCEFDNDNAGVNKPVDITLITIEKYYSATTDKTGNYEFSGLTATGIATITPKPLTLRATQDSSKTYDGTTAAAGKPLNVIGIIGSDSGKVIATGTLTFSSADVGEYNGVEVAGITLAGEKAANYSIGTTGTTKASISKAPLTLSVAQGTIKTYDSSRIATGTALSLKGFFGSDDVSATGDLTFENADAGTNKGATVTSISLQGGKKGNYSIETTGTTTASISQRTLSIASVSAYDKDYDGGVNTTGTITLSGVLNSEVSAEGTFRFSNANVDPSGNQAVLVTDISLIGDASKVANYALAQTTASTSATISKAEYSMTGVSFPNRSIPYDGKAHTHAITGILPLGVTVTYFNNNSLTNVGSQQVTARFSGDYSNYKAIRDMSARLEIIPATITGSVSITGEAKVNQVLTADISGLTNTGNPSYKWYRKNQYSADFTVISNENSKTYKVTSSDIGRTLKVEVTAQSPNYTGSKLSNATAIIAAMGPPAPSGNIAAYFLESPYDQNIINLTGFNANTPGLEASVLLNGGSYGPYQSLAVDGRGRARIYTSTASNYNTVVRTRVAATSSTSAGADKTTSVTRKNLAIGDYYQGGIVAYLGSFNAVGAGVKKGLIAAESDLSTRTIWSTTSEFKIVGTESATIGAGLANTQKILNNTAGNNAARLAADYRSGVYSGWFLPSLDELKILRTNKAAIGNFDATETYWSSTENTGGGVSPEQVQCTTANSVMVVPFFTSNVWAEFKDGYHRAYGGNAAFILELVVRPVRYF